jgi:sulfite reductase (NADPH) flavoprotein alpha-component
LPWDGETEVPTPDDGRASLREALSSAWDIRTVNKALIQKWQAHSDSEELQALVARDDRQAYDDFGWGRELIDLVVGHPARFADAAEFAGVLKKLQPRLYSVASSPKAHPGEVHLTVGVVRYEARGRTRGGVCSTFLAERCGEAWLPRVFVHTNKGFRLPADDGVPLIMVGAGTGIAPYRAFLQERRATGARGRNWLLFGNPHRATDFLYQDELAAMAAAGLLTRFDTAFSRDQGHKIYVQQRMLEAGAELWAWLQEGAVFYVCGDAERMAKDVEAALLEIAARHGGMDAGAALAWLAGLRKEKKYQRDVY